MRCCSLSRGRLPRLGSELADALLFPALAPQTRPCSPHRSHRFHSRAHAEWDDQLATCVSSDEGASLLRASVSQAQAMQVTKSCTIILNGKAVW